MAHIFIFSLWLKDSRNNHFLTLISDFYSSLTTFTSVISSFTYLHIFNMYTMMCLWPPKICILKLIAIYYGIKKLGLWKLFRS